MEPRSGWVGSARDGQLSPRVTCEGWPATEPHLCVPAPVSSDYHKRVPVHEKCFAPLMSPAR
jgi:hypothetical protein